MNRGLSVLSAAVSLLLASGAVFAEQIHGNYVETRSADVYTGPCFANGEVGLAGNQATLAWKVSTGEWNGVALDGLTVVAVARANATLGDPYHDPYPARAVLLIDENATLDQRGALVEFARAMGGRLLENVVEVKSAPISMEVTGEPHHESVALKAGGFSVVRTRPISDKDHICGNETTYYPPLTEIDHAMPAYALDHEFNGKALGSEWKIFGKRSAFVGTFSASQPGTK